MLNRCMCLAGLATLLTQSATAQATQERLFEFEGFGGYTAMNLDKWAGVNDGAEVNDWAETASGGNARLFFSTRGKTLLGIEAGYAYWMWYEMKNYWYSDSYYTYYTYPDYDVSSMHVSAVARMPLSDKVVFDLGLGLHKFEDFVDPGLHFALKYALLERPDFTIPLGVRMDAIIDSDAPIVPFALTLGFAKKF